MAEPDFKFKSPHWFNCVTLFVFLALPYNTFCVLWYLCAFHWGWEYHDHDFPVYLTLWILQIIILGTWFYIEFKPTPEEDAEFDKLMHIAIENVKQRRGDGKYTALEVKAEIVTLRQRQASNDSSNSSSSNN